jgi:hypothetical protein
MNFELAFAEFASTPLTINRYRVLAFLLDFVGDLQFSFQKLPQVLKFVHLPPDFNHYSEYSIIISDRSITTKPDSLNC